MKCGIFETSRTVINREITPCKESKTVLDCGFHAVDSEFQVLDFGLFDRGTWILDSSS